ncbi:MAG TPA: 3-isopropylmalate dehydrogenase [Vicinamibacteria bacterium]|nr:3-isopropylmalate dehydrogenase [Vicinamibacteria bacterium]
MSAPDLRIAVVPGDGIGVDVTAEGVKALTAVAEASGRTARLQSFDWGAETYLRTGVALPEDALDMLQENFDAILFGAVGDPRVPDNKHAADILLGLRFRLDLYVNHRPVKLLHEKLCPLKGASVADVDLVVFRENTEGLYVMMGGNFKKGTPDEVATEVDLNTRKGVERIVRHAFQHARQAGRTRVCMADKANVLVHAHDLWQRVFKEVAAEYAGIEATHLYVDNLCLQLVRKPAQFQVIVTSNMFGDIVTDLAAGLQGGLGMAASGNIHPGRLSLFEPVHGSAPPFAGRNVANPMGSILTTALMLEHLGWTEEGRRLEEAVRWAVETGRTTADIGGPLGTREVGDAIAARLRS